MTQTIYSDAAAESEGEFRLRLKKEKKKIRHDLKASGEGGGRAVGEAELNLSRRDKQIYEAVSQHYSVTASWTIINRPNEHSGTEPHDTLSNHCGGIPLVLPQQAGGAAPHTDRTGRSWYDEF